jgi:membrane protease subunit (stomatin/prohibitin family)
MGIFDFAKRGAQEMFIARPDGAKGQVIYKWPDQTIPMKAQLTVADDEVALFYKDGTFQGMLTSRREGPYTLETQNIPFLSLLVDKFTGGNMFKAEVWFVTIREMAGKLFGGPIGDVEDPKSGLAVGIRVRGDYSLKVEDPQKAIGLFGLKSWASDEEFEGWFVSQLKKVIRDRIAELIMKENTNLLQITSGAMTEEIEEMVLAKVGKHIGDYGMRVVRMGDFVVSMKEEDEVQLKALYKDAAQIRMAGGLAGFQQLAAGKAMMGAGEGLARGGDGGGGGNPMLAGAGLGIGAAMANMFHQQPQQPQQAAPPPMGGPPPFGAPAQHQYYVHLNGAQQGPVSFDQLRQAAQAGQFKPETPTWRNGLAGWGPASAVPELAPIFAPPAGGPPPFGGPPPGGPPPFGG